MTIAAVSCAVEGNAYRRLVNPVFRQTASYMGVVMLDRTELEFGISCPSSLAYFVAR